MLLALCYFLYDTCYMLLAICYLLCVTCCMLLAICFLFSDAFYLKLAIPWKNLFPFGHFVGFIIIYMFQRILKISGIGTFLFEEKLIIFTDRATKNRFFFWSLLNEIFFVALLITTSLFIHSFFQLNKLLPLFSVEQGWLMRLSVKETLLTRRQYIRTIFDWRKLLTQSYI